MVIRPDWMFAFRPARYIVEGFVVPAPDLIGDTCLGDNLAGFGVSLDDGDGLLQGIIFNIEYILEVVVPLVIGIILTGIWLSST